MARWFVDRLPQQGIPSVSLRRLLCRGSSACRGGLGCLTSLRCRLLRFQQIVEHLGQSRYVRA